MRLYETTRRRRIYRITIDWKTKNRRIVITNKNKYRADIRRAEESARLEKKLTNQADYENKILENNERIYDLNNKLFQERQDLERYKTKSIEHQNADLYRGELQKALNNAQQCKSQLDSLDKKQTAQRIKLTNDWNYFMAEAKEYESNLNYNLNIINNPNYYTDNINNLKKSISLKEKEISDLKSENASLTLTNEQIKDSFEDAKTRREKAEFNDVIRVSKQEQKGICGLRIDFEVNKSTLGGSNKTTIKIYNLRQELRELLFQDYWIPGQDSYELKSLKLEAGYEGDGLNLIFRGDIRQCFSYLQGVDVITEISGFDTSIDNQYKFETRQFETNQDRYGFIKKTLGGSLENGLTMDFVDVENLSTNPIQAPIIISNKTLLEIKKYAIDKDNYPMEVFIDNGKVNVLSRKTGYIGRDKPFVISSETNLLETPKRYGTHILCKCLFMPRIEIAQIVSLYSEVETAYQGKNLLAKQMEVDKLGRDIVKNTGLAPGNYKVISIKHSGSISDTDETKVITELQLITGGLILRGTDK